MKQALLTLVALLSLQFVYGQERIDGSSDFKTAKDKKYSIYVPSTYKEGVNNKLMVALHPWNTSRWGAKSWCDTLVDFAEKNGLLVLCTDGGSDGKVDDAIDTAFTNAMLDSMLAWYSVDEQRIFLMGFSWGGRTTYTHGLSNAHRFAGFMPIGAAIATSDVPGAVRANAKNTPWYVIHGRNDAPATRYSPMLELLNNNGAITETNYLNGVGHTIDFPNRNKILSRGFRWLDSTNDATLNTGLLEKTGYQGDIQISYSITTNEVALTAEKAVGMVDFKLLDINGREVYSTSIDLSSHKYVLVLPPVPVHPGIFFITVSNDFQLASRKIILNQ